MCLTVSQVTRPSELAHPATREIVQRVVLTWPPIDPPAVGPLTALVLVLIIGTTGRFGSGKQGNSLLRFLLLRTVELEVLAEPNPEKFVSEPQRNSTSEVELV